MADNPENNAPGGEQSNSEYQSYQNYGDDQRQENNNQNLELDMAHTLIHPSPASPFRISPAVVPWTQQIQQMQQITQTQIRMLEDQVQQMRAQMQTQQQHIEQIQQALNTRNNHQMRDRASTERQQPSNLPDKSQDSRPSQITNTEDATTDGRTETRKGVDTLESESSPPLPPSNFLLLNGAPHAADATYYTTEPIIERHPSSVEQKRAGEEEFETRTAKRPRHTQALEDVDTAETQREEDTQTEDQASLERPRRRQELTLPQRMNADTEEQQRQQVISENNHPDQVARRGPLVISEFFRDYQPVLQTGPPLTGYLSRNQEPEKQRGPPAFSYLSQYQEQEQRRGPPVSLVSKSNDRGPEHTGPNTYPGGTMGAHGVYKICLRCGGLDHLSFQKICPQHPRNKK
ncbi:uncharacterized protein EAE98_008336 [Botrytis deweyae]|uniref:Uncharacterized protein n=1 Tax=Botrytis deweyae TaxID=2478750 RepID=A0ABQ7IF34_9HELO|nr:uncharacterized protein EAE98_008336 [Botrytis deweyae]KAF7922125.1 hypothetical protein EAE98_008336 [Botrytis deweyae]